MNVRVKNCPIERFEPGRFQQETFLSKQDVWQMKQRLPIELQKHLKKKLFNLLSYYQPEWGKPLTPSQPTSRKYTLYITTKLGFYLTCPGS